MHTSNCSGCLGSKNITLKASLTPSWSEIGSNDYRYFEIHLLWWSLKRRFCRFEMKSVSSSRSLFCLVWIKPYMIPIFHLVKFLRIQVFGKTQWVCWKTLNFKRKVLEECKITIHLCTSHCSFRYGPILKQKLITS